MGEKLMGEKLTGCAFIFMGIVYLLSSIGMMYFLIIIGGLLEITRATPWMTGMPAFTTYLAAAWVFAILELVTGFISLAAGIAILVKPKEKA